MAADVTAQSLVFSLGNDEMQQQRSSVTCNSNSEEGLVSAKAFNDAQNWCSVERARLAAITTGDGKTLQFSSDKSTIHREFQAVLVDSLQQDTLYMWSYFTEVVATLQPIKQFVQDFSECQHYIERIVQHCNTQKDHLKDVPIIATLQKIFPTTVKKVCDTNAQPKQIYCTPFPPSRSLTPTASKRVMRASKSSVHPSLLLPDGTNPFLLDRPGEEDKFAPVNKSLTFGDLRKSIAVVGMEAANRESVWNNSAGFLLNAFKVDPPEDPRLLPKDTSADVIHEGDARKLMEEVMMSSETAAENLPVEPMTAREAVVYFAKMYHLGKIRHMFFNIVDNQRYTPYDLVAVPKRKVKPDHYMFSTFGVLHVSKSQPCEAMSLGEWFRQAVLHKAISNIPFFKDYLLKRYFQGWLSVKKKADYVRVRREMGYLILQCVPNYGSACLAVCKLLHELSTLHFLPLDKTICYTISSWRSSVNDTNQRAEKFLERFYVHVRNVVEHARKEQFEKLHFCEKQVGNKAVFTKESLSLSNKKQKLREENLMRCRDETNRLGNFIQLTDQLILARLVTIVKLNVSSFVHEVMQNVPDSKRIALFKCALVFNDKGDLDISPTQAEFEETISGTINKIPEILCDISFGIDAYYLIIERVANLKPESRYTAIGTSSKEMTRSRLERTSVMAKSRAQSSAAEARDESVQEKATPGLRVKLVTPELSDQRLPCKSDNDMAVKTPDMAVPVEAGLELKGTGFIGNYAPLASGNVQKILDNNVDHMKAIIEKSSILNESFCEIHQFVTENNWLNEINNFCTSWDLESKLNWKGAQAFHIEGYNSRESAVRVEQQLTQIRSWIERIKSFEKSFQTTNLVFMVDCTRLHSHVIPQLEDIYKEIVEFVADQAWILANAFIEDMKEIVENMTCKSNNMDQFARYAKQVNEYKKYTGAYQKQVEYIKSLFEVIRMSFRQPTADEERLEGQVQIQWEAFLGQMQDASEYINIQTPIMLQSLEESYEALLDEAEQLGMQATTGQFLDPQEDPTKMLITMRHLRDSFYDVQKKLEQASKWKEAITGTGYELTFLQTINNHMNVRQELWKYVEVSTHAIKDWKQQLFRKMNVQKALDKIIEWITVATQMHDYLPESDAVLAHWFKMLHEFKKDLPLLHKMANDALKVKHWKAIFVGMGELYEPTWQFTVEELLSYNLGSHSDLINAIFSRAKAEYTIEQKLIKLEKMWHQNDVYFKLAKHIPDAIYNAANNSVRPRAPVLSAFRPEKSRLDHRRGTVERFRASRTTLLAPKGLDLTSDDLYVLVDVDELRYLLEDSQVSLQQMLSSPYATEFRGAVESLYDKLREVDEILDLWCTCQTKWLYLMKLFEDPGIYARMSGQSFQFETVHARMKEIQKVILADPGIMAITTHARGSRGYRTLQGENLLKSFSNMIHTQEELLKKFVLTLEKTRQEFPRLYFVTDDDIMELMAVVRSPQHFMPIAKICFPGIELIRFCLPNTDTFNNSVNPTLDCQLNGDKLEGVVLFGEKDESIELISRVKALHNGPAWLSQLQRLMKRTMVKLQEECVMDFLKHGETIDSLESLMAEVTEIESKSPLQETNSLPLHLTKEHVTYNSRLLRYPLQCILITEAILWSRKVTQALQKTEFCRDRFHFILKTLRNKRTHACKLMKENACYVSGGTAIRARVSFILRSLINCYMHLINKTESFSDIDMSCLNCYDWSSTFRYNMEITPLLRAKSLTVVEKDETFRRDRSRLASELHTVPPTSDSSVSTSTTLTPLSKRRPTHLAADLLAEKRHTSCEVMTSYVFGPLTLQQLDARYRYDYEYIGPSQKLVMTPLTERAQFSLMMAMKNFHVGTLIGPSSVGKTETINSLAEAFGTCVFPMNCCAEMRLCSLRQVLSGVVQSGCWALFNETDRWTTEMMSVCANQLQAITHSLRVLKYSKANEYGMRGFPNTEKYCSQKFYIEEQSPKIVRRNSLTTLHSLKQSDIDVNCEGSLKNMQRVHTFYPDREGTFTTYFCDEYRPRRHSISKEINIKDTEMYKENAPPPLFYEKVMQTIKPTKEVQDFKQMFERDVVYSPCYIGNLMYNGYLMPARDNAACFMTLNTHSVRNNEIPSSLRLLMRPCAMICPDVSVIVDSTLFAWGCPQHQLLTDKLMLFIEFCKIQLPNSQHYDFSLRTLHSMLQLTMDRIYNPAMSVEPKEDVTNNDLLKPTKWEEALVFGMTTVMMPQLQKGVSLSIFQDALRDIFPLASSIAAPRHDPELVEAIKKQIQTAGFQHSEIQLSKILELWQTLQQGNNVILLGPSGSGKTTAYRILSQALNKLQSRTADQVSSDHIEPTKTQSFLQTKKPKGLAYLSPLRHHEPDCTLKVPSIAVTGVDSTPVIPEEEISSEVDITITSSTRLSHDSNKPLAVSASESSSTSVLEDTSVVYDFTKALKILKTMETRQRSHLIKKWGNISRTFARFGSLHQNAVGNVKSSYETCYPRVNLQLFCPGSMNSSELFGNFKNDTWQQGLLSHLLESMYNRVQAGVAFTQTFSEKKNKFSLDSPSINENWLVMDGDLVSSWVDNIYTIMDSSKKMTLANTKSIYSTNFTSLLFETGSLCHASPAGISRCAVVHCPAESLPWRTLIDSWTATARHKWMFTPTSLKMVGNLINDTFENTLKFLQTEGSLALDAHLGDTHGSYKNSVRGVHEVQAFLRLFNALLDRYMLREVGDSPDLTTVQLAGKSASSSEELDKKNAKTTTKNTPSSVNVSDAGHMTSNSNSSQSQQQTITSRASRTTSIKDFDEEKELHRNVVKCIFAYSYIWAFGGHLHDDSKFKFDKFVREALHRCSEPVTMPRTGSVYDLYVNASEGILFKWQDHQTERLRSIPANYAVTPDIERYFRITELLLSCHNHVLITGAPGVGKTALVQSMIMTRQPITRVNVSPGLSSAQFQETILVRMRDLRQKSMPGPSPQTFGANRITQKHMFFIDDINTCSVTSDGSGTQPCLETLREMVSHKITYDRTRLVFEDTKNATFLAACSTPGHSGTGFGVNSHSPADRLIRQFTVVNFFTPNDDSMHSLYGKTLQSWLEEFPSYAVEHHYEFSKAMLQGILEVYKVMKEKFRATPAHAHYVFTLHDIAHVIEGMLLLSPRKTKAKPRRARAKRDHATTNAQSLFGGMLPGGKLNKEKFKALSVKDSKDTKMQSDNALPMMPVIVRLWCHEVTRTFADRLLLDEDEAWFKRTLEDLVEKYFCTASPDWRDAHPASKNAKAIHDFEGNARKDGQIKGTPLPFGKPSPDDEEEEDSDSSDGSMTEVTADVITPFSERDAVLAEQEEEEEEDMREDSLNNRGAQRRPSYDEYDHLGLITPFTETTVNLPELPITPERDDEKPTLPGHFGEMHQQRLASSTSNESDSDEERTVTNFGTGTVETGISDDLTNFTSLTPITWETQSVGLDSRRDSLAISDMTEVQVTANKTETQHHAAVSTGGVIRKKRTIRHADSKRGVTFKMGLIADKEIVEEYKGAFMTFEEIRNASDDLIDIMFSKFFISTYADYVGMNCERGYAQYNENQLTEALDACLHIYNNSTGLKLNMVFFREAVRHATRISRVLSFPGAHAVLLGLPHSAGRTTLTRLASHTSHCKLFEVKNLSTVEETWAEFRCKVKQCSHMAGVPGRPTTLYVHSGVPEKVLQDLCCLMTEGRCPGLYTDADMQNMATAMTPGQVQTKRIDKIELAFERYLKKVRQNMHIIVALDYSASKCKETSDLLRKYPQLITKSAHIDCYKPWTFTSYQYIAKKWLMNPTGPQKIPWDSDLYTDQLTSASKAMAYIHKTAEAAIERRHCHQSTNHKFFTPLTFQEFHTLLQAIAHNTAQKAKIKGRNLKEVLDKVDEAFTSIKNLDAQASMLEPKLEAADDVVKRLKDEVENLKVAYVEALDECKKVEEKLERLQKPLDDLKGEADAEFDKASPRRIRCSRTSTSRSSTGNSVTKSVYTCSPSYFKQKFLKKFKKAKPFYKAHEHTTPKLLNVIKMLSKTFKTDKKISNTKDTKFMNYGAIDLDSMERRGQYVPAKTVHIGSVRFRELSLALLDKQHHKSSQHLHQNQSQHSPYQQTKLAYSADISNKSTEETTSSSTTSSTRFSSTEMKSLSKDQVNPTYYAAMEAINMLKQGDMEELKSYRIPPKSIHIVGEVLCIMFQQESIDWETAKMLMFKSNFYQELEFYDKNHVPNNVFKKLANYCANPEFDPSYISKGSLAAGSICAWIHAVYKYAAVYRQVSPKLANLLQAEQELNEPYTVRMAKANNEVYIKKITALREFNQRAQAELGQKRIVAMKSKQQLERLIQSHKEAALAARNIEKRYKLMRQRISDSKQIMASMELQNKIWRLELMESDTHVVCAPGDAILAAAISCYHGPFDPHTREALINDWRERCIFNEFDMNANYTPRLVQLKTSGRHEDMLAVHVKLKENINSSAGISGPRKLIKNSKRPLLIREDFSLENIMSDFNETSEWIRNGLPRDSHTLHSILMLRSASEHHKHFWPFIIDPDMQAAVILKLLYKDQKAVSTVATPRVESQPVVGIKSTQDLRIKSIEEKDALAVQSDLFDDQQSSTSISQKSVSSSSEVVLNSTDIPALEVSYMPKLTAVHSSESVSGSGAANLPPVQLNKHLSPEQPDLSHLKADRYIDRPDGNIWVLSATDSALCKYLVNAIVHGVIVLVQHLEQKTLDRDFQNLLSRHFSEDGEGNKTVKINEFTYFVHPQFRLYLSINTPLFLVGDDTTQIPIGHCNLIDLSISQQGKIDSLLMDLMRIEKSDFEAQIRSIENGILQHKQELDEEHESIQDKIANLSGAILDDETMFSSLVSCYQSVSRNLQILEETAYLKNQLEQKRESYLPVALHAAVMYDVIDHMSILSSYYYLPFAKYKLLCVETISLRYRGKGASGAVKARCQELINAITEAVFKLTGGMYFEMDGNVFAMLVAIQRLLSSESVTNAEVLVFVNNVNNVKLTQIKECPSWMKHESWLQCCKLEITLPCFTGLTDSLISHQKEWKEYFSKPMSVVAVIPGDSIILTIFQKCILWKVVQPSRFSEVCHNLLLTELGPNIAMPTLQSTNELITAAPQNTPVLLMEPGNLVKEPHDSGSGFSNGDPVELIRSLVSPNDFNARIQVLSFGTDVSMKDVEWLLTHCIANGLWVVLCNCHLAPRWSPAILALFEKILAIKAVQYTLDEATMRLIPTVSYEVLNPGIHPGFRLWLTSKHTTQNSRTLPGCLLWNCIKITCEQTKSYKNMVKSMYAQAVSQCRASNADSSQTNSLTAHFILPVALLHGHILHRSYFAKAAFNSSSHWNAVDFNTVLQAMPSVLSSCQGPNSLIRFMQQTYSNHCTDMNDKAIIQSLVETLVLPRVELPDDKIELSARGSKAMLALIQPDPDEDVPISIEQVNKRLDGVAVTNASTVGLPDCADLLLAENASRIITNNLLKVSGSPEVIMDSVHFSSFERVDALLSGWESAMQDLSELPTICDDKLNALDRFFQHEVASLKHILYCVKLDSERLQSIVRGEHSCCLQSEEMIMALHDGKVPSKWRALLFSSSESLMKWKWELQQAITRLVQYTDQATKPLAYCLSVFPNPDLFLNALLINHARTTYSDVNDLELHAEFLTLGFMPSTPPTSGCYIKGLKLCNAMWDTQLASMRLCDNEDTVSLVPILHLQPRLKTQTACARTTFRCPVLLSDCLNSSSSQEAVLYVNVRVTSDQLARDLTERRAFLSSQLKYDES